MRAILVTYDVNTKTSAGRRRLRRVAKICESYGQRVQKSVFECQVDSKTFHRLKERLLREVSLAEDNLRIYHLPSPVDDHVLEYGEFRRRDFNGPLVL